MGALGTAGVATCTCGEGAPLEVALRANPGVTGNVDCDRFFEMLDTSLAAFVAISFLARSFPSFSVFALDSLSFFSFASFSF